MTRSHEHEITIHAPAEQVWRALTDPVELTKWYVEDADLEPREGGRYWVSWGEGMEGTGRITVWDPPRRLRLEHRPPENPPEGWPDPPPMERPIFEEFTMSEADGVTTLRLQHGDIPDSSDWDAFYDGTDTGWAGYFYVLRHYLERHAGEDAQTVTVMAKIPDGMSDADAWARIRTLDGLRVEGEVIEERAPNSLLMTVSSMDDALLGIMLLPGSVYVSVWRYGADPDEVAEQQQRWQAWFSERLT